MLELRVRGEGAEGGDAVQLSSAFRGSGRTMVLVSSAIHPAFADAVRTAAERLRAATAAAMTGGPGPVAAPQQMERRIALLSAQLEAMRAVSTAAGPLYAAFSEEQRRTADELMAEHFRAMRMGMP
jgi:hypothetical protein